MNRKLKSVKTWIVFWAVSLITYIVICDKVSFISLATLIATIPLAYIPVNGFQKKIDADKEVKLKELDTVEKTEGK